MSTSPQNSALEYTGPTEGEIKAFQARLASPFLPAADEELSKTRMRLLVAGSFCLAVGAFGLRIEEHPQFLGITVVNFTDNVFRTILVIVTGYLFVHFTWQALDAFME